MGNSGHEMPLAWVSRFVIVNNHLTEVEPCSVCWREGDRVSSDLSGVGKKFLSMPVCSPSHSGSASLSCSRASSSDTPFTQSPPKPGKVAKAWPSYVGSYTA